MSWAEAFDTWPLICAALCGLAGAAQAIMARYLHRRLFGLAILFGSASAVFALAGRDGRNAEGDDPAAQAAALCILLVGLGVVAMGAALAMRQREVFGAVDDDAAQQESVARDAIAAHKARS